MTVPATSLPVLAAPPADERSPAVLTEMTYELDPIPVPLCSLRDDDVIRRHPDTDESVVWKVIDWRFGEGAYVTYTVPGSDEEHRFEFAEPQPMLLVEHPAGVSR